MSRAWNAWSWETDPDSVRRDMAVAHEHFTGSGRIGERVRPVVGDSWRRSAQHGVDPDRAPPRLELTGHTHLTIDVVPGWGSGFSVEAPTGQRFLIRSRLMSDEEAVRLEDEN